MSIENARTPSECDPNITILRQQREQDLAAIRAAIVEDIDNFDTYSKIADKQDEATLNGKRSILTLFDVYVRWLTPI